MELVDVPDSKSGEDHTSCRFDPDHRQIKRPLIVVFLFDKKLGMFLIVGIVMPTYIITTGYYNLK